MEKRRGFFVAAVVLAGATGIASACSFPEPTFVGGDGAEGGASSSSSSSGSGPRGDGGGSADVLVDSVFAIDGNQNVDPGGASQEASVAPEAGPQVDASGCPDKCDCDNDMVRSNDASCTNPGKDCNDLDPFIPHDGFVASKPVGHNGDWDCDGKVTKQFPVNINCGLLANCSASGFTGDPGCGEPGEFVTCKPSILPLVTCDVKSTETVIQGCR